MMNPNLSFNYQKLYFFYFLNIHYASRFKKTVRSTFHDIKSLTSQFKDRYLMESIFY